jgi:hypothetical protein
MSKQSKNVKLNMTIEQEFYEELKRQAYQRHLPVATYARQVLMDGVPENNSKNNNHERR